MWDQQGFLVQQLGVYGSTWLVFILQVITACLCLCLEQKLSEAVSLIDATTLLGFFLQLMHRLLPSSDSTRRPFQTSSSSPLYKRQSYPSFINFEPISHWHQLLGTMHRSTIFYILLFCFQSQCYYPIKAQGNRTQRRA